MSPSLRVGIIGARIGARHLAGLVQVPAARVTAICDLDTARAAQIAAENGQENVEIFADYREMLEKGDLDAVTIGLPNFLHRQVTTDCLQAGLHVLSEKPLALNAAEAQEIADTAVRTGKKCMVGQVVRFRDDARALKNLVEEGKMGRVYYAHTGWLRKRGIPGFGGWFTNKAQSGGGPLIDIGVHLLDLAWWLCGCPKPVAASGAAFAEFGPRGKGRGAGQSGDLGAKFDVEDLASALIRFEGGGVINLEISWAVHTENDNQWCQIYGTDGGCDWGERTLFHTEDQTVRLEAGRGEMWKAEMEHFVSCILEDKTPDPDAAQGVTMMKMLDAIYQSAEEKREIVIA